MRFAYLRKPRAWLRRQRYQRTFPDVAVGLDAYITGETLIGKDSTIGEDCRIVNSSLGNHVTLSANCRVSESHLGDHVALLRDCKLSESQVGNHIRLGDNCSLSKTHLEDRITISSDCDITSVVLGRYSYVAGGSIIGQTTIGRFCSIGPSLMSGYGEHPTDLVSTSPVFYSRRGQCGITFADRDYFEELKNVQIGNDVWIGARVFLRNGISIGDGAIVGAGAVVAENVPAFAIVGGVPAKLIRMRYNDVIIAELLRVRWWDWSESALRTAQPLFAQNDVRLFLRSLGG